MYGGGGDLWASHRKTLYLPKPKPFSKTKFICQCSFANESRARFATLSSSQLCNSYLTFIARQTKKKYNNNKEVKYIEWKLIIHKLSFSFSSCDLLINFMYGFSRMEITALIFFSFSFFYIYLHFLLPNDIFLNARIFMEKFYIIVVVWCDKMWELGDTAQRSPVISYIGQVVRGGKKEKWGWG